MKKIIGLLSLFIIVFPVGVFAVEYEIEETKIRAALQDDGTVDVEERHTYTFEGEFNGITRSLLPKKNSEITDITASEDGKELEVEQEDEVYKIYRAGEEETISIDLTYTIRNGVEVYADVAQFYWPFFDSEKESAYEDMTVTVVPPEPTDAEAAYGKHAAYETSDFSSDGEVTFAMGHVGENEKGDIRVAYDASLFPQADQTSDEEMLPSILADKEKLDEQMARKAERHEFFSGIGPYVIGGFGLIALLLSFGGWRRRKETLREAERQKGGTGRFPETSMSLPAMLMFTNYSQVTTQMITSALLELVRKGYVEKVSEEEFRVVDRNTEYQHENLLIGWLFDEVGKDGVFHVNDLEVYVESEENATRYQEWFRSWSEAVKQEFKQYDLYEDNTKPRWIAGIAALVILPFTILFPVYNVFIWMAGAMVLFFYFLVFAIAYRPLTFEGQRIKQELEPLKTGDQWKEWEEKDQLTAFLYQVGAGKRKPDVHLPTSAVTANDLVLFMVLAGTLDQSFQRADSHVSAATSSGAGAGSGTGVGGGGGGSGAF